MSGSTRDARRIDTEIDTTTDCLYASCDRIAGGPGFEGVSRSGFAVTLTNDQAEPSMLWISGSDMMVPIRLGDKADLEGVASLLVSMRTNWSEYIHLRVKPYIYSKGGRTRILYIACLVFELWVKLLRLQNLFVYCNEMVDEQIFFLIE